MPLNLFGAPKLVATPLDFTLVGQVLDDRIKERRFNEGLERQENKREGLADALQDDDPEYAEWVRIMGPEAAAQIRDSQIRGSEEERKAMAAEAGRAGSIAKYIKGKGDDPEGMAQRAKLVMGQPAVYHGMDDEAKAATQADLGRFQTMTHDEMLNELDADIAMSVAAAGALKPFGSTTLRRTPEGDVMSGMGVDPAGNISVINTPLLPGQQLLAGGQTAQEKADRQVQTATKVAKAQQEAKVAAQEELDEFAVQLEFDKTVAKDKAAFIKETIAVGLQAADGLPQMEHGLELIKQVQTSGMVAMKKRLTDFFGTTDPKLAKLNRILAQKVLNSLQNFPGQISNEERQYVVSIEAGISQNREFNQSELEEGIRILKKYKARGLAAAKKHDRPLAFDFMSQKFDPNMTLRVPTPPKAPVAVEKDSVAAPEETLEQKKARRARMVKEREALQGAQQ